MACGGINYRTDNGNDYVQICHSVFQQDVTVQMGFGNDGLCVAGDSVFQDTNVVFDGGVGTNDTRSIFESTFAGSPILGDITPGFEFDFDDCSFFPEADGTCGF
jgi:hypothetical protein